MQTPRGCMGHHEGMTESFLPATPTRPAVVVRRSKKRHRTLSARQDGDHVLVMVPWGMDPDEERRKVEKLVTTLLNRRRRYTATTDEELMERADRLAKSYLDPVVGSRVRPSSVRWVTNQNHRWGSCTVRTGQIRLSARMAVFPRWVSDYVLLHELCHLVEPNHGSRFHELLSRYPQADKAEGFLTGWSWATSMGGTDGGEGTDAMDPAPADID